MNGRDLSKSGGQAPCVGQTEWHSDLVEVDQLQIRMDDRDRNILRKNRTFILDNLQNVKSVVDILFEKEALTEEMKDEILIGKKTLKNKVRALIDILPKRGPTAFQCFIEALEESQNQHLVKQLAPNEPERSSIQKESRPSLPEKWPNSDIDVLKMQVTRKPHYPQHHSDDAYSITSSEETRKRGRVLIINNMVFKTEDLGYRAASDEDVKNMTNLFTKLHFHVDPEQRDLSAEDIMDLLDKERRNHEHQNSQCFVCIILTHGSQEGVYGTDGVVVTVKKITDKFDGQNCPNLKGKPKLFFIQACQGEGRDSGAYQSQLNESTQRELEEALRQVNMDVTDAKTEQPYATKADMFIAKSTTEGYVSYRNTRMGSWFILAISFIFKNYACEEHVADMMTKVNHLVSKGRAHDDGRECVVVPQQQTTLTKKLFLYP
ncbi:hypothetical protein ScPMuIL_008257 [Solemya velum]